MKKEPTPPKRMSVIVAFKKTGNVLFVINLKNEREISDIQLKDITKNHFQCLGYEKVEVSLVPVIAHYTDIKVEIDGEARLLDWTLKGSYSI